MDGIVYFGKGALEVPVELLTVVFVFFEALEFFDEIEFEFGTYPCSKLKGNIPVCKASSVAPGFWNDTFCIGGFNPALVA